MEYYSTSHFAKLFGVPAAQLFSDLQQWGWIERSGDKWVLTQLGRQKGGEARSNSNYGEYIVWPEDIFFEEDLDRSQFLNSTSIGDHFKISSRRMNLILSELGWIEKAIAGWVITKLGRELGGRQLEHDISGGTYVLWPKEIVNNPNLRNIFFETVLEAKDAAPVAIKTEATPIEAPLTDSFRNKFPATFRTKDGHMVRSRAEVIIDNALYDYKLVHAYERKVPIEEDLYSDFFLPAEGVYIEYWGMEHDEKYRERKKVKLDLYKKNELKLIELTDEDLANLDDHLPRKLLKHNIKVY